LFSLDRASTHGGHAGLRRRTYGDGSRDGGATCVKFIENRMGAKFDSEERQKLRSIQAIPTEAKAA